jgi:Raf kinase inhibitor-like YbhB/YbcL family protein
MLEKLPSKLGRALRGLRADEDRLAFHDPSLAAVPTAIEVTSPEFTHHGTIPARYTADGEGLSPPLTWHGVPSGAASVVVLMEDADSPTPQPLVHAIVWGLEGGDGALAAGALPRSGAQLPPSTPMGRNSLLTVGYLPPDPPSGHGTHRYVFEVFALDARMKFETAPGRGKVLEWLRTHAIAKGMLTGLYERP